MWRYPWRLGDDDDVDLTDAPTRVAYARHRGLQHPDGVAAGVRRIGIGEHLADVPERGGAEHGIRDGVRNCVAVGVTVEVVVHLDTHAAEHQRPARLEAVRIVADADANGERVTHGMAHADALSVSSTKSATGHMLGAAGGVELIASTLAIRDQIVPPTINYKTADPECPPLNFTPNVPQKREVRACISNSAGFGGHNVSLAIKRFEE